ncbi:hypothetical protein FisN_27Hh034 [Fistulifera solaris]|uniref:Fe2OG dioxygenase domain-containing protein n=1 Tax=Fistulifera solaris TaxID=1519565 RepID=A0A1Z5KQM8_FISSO|nr:hypothetical protein FisN_27Hh034 [Fistulifera solaris]|eukprot:GAX28311.1 hypothetical protein FisN_27Hh034 [Fistulifera solaris]
MLIERAEQTAATIPLQEAIEVRWAVRGLMASQPSLQSLAVPQLEQRVSRLPFDILPCGVSDLQSVSAWQQDIPFQFDTIITRTGANVQERRGTAWVAEEGIGALAYSGKLMAPHPLPTSVTNVMRQVEHAMFRTESPFFDCALCNWYPYGESACKFHTDPEHGTMWDRLTCVVAAGDARRFAFRPIQTSWEDWDTNQQAGTSQKNGINNEPAVIRLFPGDIVKMYDTCNDDFHHAVYPDADGRGRVSLVLKRALPRGSKGQRGHGLAGQGRRSRGNKR